MSSAPYNAEAHHTERMWLLTSRLALRSQSASPRPPRVVRGPDPAFMGKARIVVLWAARPRGELLACARQAIAGQPCGLHSPQGRASHTLRGITPGSNPGHEEASAKQRMPGSVDQGAGHHQGIFAATHSRVVIAAPADFIETVTLVQAIGRLVARSEERRVGEECRSR